MPERVLSYHSRVPIPNQKKSRKNETNSTKFKKKSSKMEPVTKTEFNLMDMREPVDLTSGGPLFKKYFPTPREREKVR